VIGVCLGLFVSDGEGLLEMSVGCFGFWMDGKLSIGEPSSATFAFGSKSCVNGQ
jgi:hypothetical protein